MTSYDAWKTTEPQEREPAPTCDRCDERPATRTIIACGLETCVCDICSGRAAECDQCSRPSEGYYTRLGAPICLSCWEESDDGIAFRDNRRTFQASFAGSR